MSSTNSLSAEFAGARVIVTGASGFIGLNMVELLSGMGADVLVIDRNQPSQHFDRVEFEWADLKHLDKTYEADYLIHLAAITNAGYAERYPIDTYEINVLGTLNLLNHVKIRKRVLFPSTALIYETSERPIAEDWATELSATYAQSKHIGEQVIRSLCKRMGVAYTIVRFFNIFGPGQLPMYIVPQVLRQIIDHKRIELRNGSVMRDLLYVDDCIDAVLKLVQSPGAEDNVFNIGSGRIVTIADVARAAVGVSGDETVEIVDQQQTIAYSPTAILADISKVKSTIDWHPRTSLDEGLSNMWRSYVGATKPIH